MKMLKKCMVLPIGMWGSMAQGRQQGIFDNCGVRKTHAPHQKRDVDQWLISTMR